MKQALRSSEIHTCIEDTDNENYRSLTIFRRGIVCAKIHVEAVHSEVVVSIFQYGEPMLDAQVCMRMVESTKRRNHDNVFGGQYGLGFKQFLGVVASMEAEGWGYDMFGTVTREHVSGGEGWSRITPRSVNNSLVVEGRVLWGSIRSWVLYFIIYDNLYLCMHYLGSFEVR